MKKGLIKAGVFGVFILFIFGVIFFILFSSTTSGEADTPKDSTFFNFKQGNTYILDSILKFDLSKTGNYEITIVYPSGERNFRVGSNDRFSVDLIEEGNYSIYFKRGNEKKSYTFVVISSSLNLPIITAPISTTTDEGELIQEKAEINKPVHWKKTLNETIIEIPEIKNLTIKKKNGEVFSNYEMVESHGKKYLQINELSSEQLTLEYSTESPRIDEVSVSENKKEVVIYSPEEISYQDVLSYTNLPKEVLNKDSIQIYWKEKNSYLDFNASDKDGNGLLDYVEWIVPHLSNQTFEIIIITKAEHLDSNRLFISDIYEELKELDNIWSEEIPDGDYVRVTFEVPLDNTRDITIYPLIISGNPRIGVYEKDSSELIAEFNPLINNTYNKIYLTNLISEDQDTFDLKVINGIIKIDYIVDPTLTINSSNSPYILCGNVTAYDKIVVESTGILTVCPYNGSSWTGSVNISLGSNGNFTVYPGGIVNLSYAGGLGGQPSVTSGIGVGGYQGMNSTFNAGVQSTSANGGGGGGGQRNGGGAADGGGGGGFGGIGGTGADANNGGNDVPGEGGNTYGSDTSERLFAGSGGGGGCGDTMNTSALPGGRGAGGIKINVGKGFIGVYGSIYAEGQQGGDVVGTITSDVGAGGGGSGGHIILIGGEVIIPGTLSVNGGRGGNAGTGAEDFCGGGGGGGGRIYISSTILDNSSITATISGGAAGATGTSCNPISTAGSDGIIFYSIESDTNAPYFTYIPANASLFYGNESLGVDFNAEDNIKFGYYSINDTRFSINQTGFLRNATPLAVENYEINVTINDTFNNINWTRYKVQINKNQENCQIFFNETSPLESPGTFLVWANCSSPFNLYRNGTLIDNNSEQALSVSAYNFSMFREDTQNYSIFFNQSEFRIIDTIFPLVDFGASSPLNNSKFARTWIYADANVIEQNEVNITFNLYYSNYTLLNSSTYTDSRRIINWTNLAEGIYYFNISVFDIAGHLNSSSTRKTNLNFSIPTLNYIFPTEENGFSFSRNWIYVNISASGVNEEVNITFGLYNDSGLVNLSIYTDSRRTINWTLLPDSNYYYNVTLFDNPDGRIYTLTRQITLDTTPPYFTSIPSNASLFYGNESLSVDFDATDNYAFGYYSVNDTRFLIDQTGLLTNTTPLAVGNYEVNVSINDTLNHLNWTRYKLQINKSQENCQIFFNETSPLPHPKTFLVWANCTSPFALYRNGTLISNNSEQVLIAGAYNFSMLRTDSENYSILFNQEEFRIIDYLLRIINPTSSNPLIVSDGINISVYFNYTFEGSNITSGVSVDSVFIGGVNSSIIPSLNHSKAYSANKIYENASQTGASIPPTWPQGWVIGRNATAYNAYWNTTISDNINYTYASTLGNAEIITKFNFTITEPIETITSITLIGEYNNPQSGGTGEMAGMFVANWSSNTWEIIGSQTRLSKATQTITYTNPSEFSNIIQGNEIVLLFESGNADSSETLQVDYVTIIVNSTSPRQFDYISNVGWNVNVTVPSGLKGLKNLFLNATYEESTKSNIQLNAIDYGDTAPPYFTKIPNNASLFYGNESLGVDFDAEDDAGFGYYRINDTRFSINQTGFLSNVTPLAVGNYEINVTINDTYNKINWTRYKVQINKSSYYNCAVYFNTSGPITYPSTFIAYTNCSSDYTLYRNGTLISNNTVINSGAGYYNLTVQRTDTQNYTNIFNSAFFTVSKSSDSCSVYFNTSSPLTYPNLFIAYTNCTSAYTLRVNGTTITNASAVNSGASAYNISVQRTDIQNYTSTFNQAQFIINKNSEQFRVLFNATSPLTYPDVFLVWANATSPFTLYRNGTVISNNSEQRNGAGYFNFTAIRADTANYTYNFNSSFFTINKNTENCQVLFNTTSPLNYSDTFLVWANCSSPFTLYRNGTLISNNSEQALPVSIYNFSMLRIDSENYTLYFNQTQFRVIDVTKPNATLIFPENNTYLNNSQQNLTLNATDDFGLSNMTLSVYNETHLINETTQDISGTEIITGIVYNFLYDGVFKWFYKIFDIEGNSFDTKNNTIIIDTTYSLISFGSGTEDNNVNLSRNWIYVNLSITELNEANITFNLYDSQYNLFNSSSYNDSRREINWTGLNDGIYYYNITVIDLAYNANSTSTRKIGLDTVGPTVNILEPESKAYGYNTSLPLTYTIRDNVVGVSMCWWNLDNQANQSIACGTNITFDTSEGLHTLNFYSNDTLNHLSVTGVSFSVSTTGPAITLIIPSNKTYFTSIQNQLFNFTATDSDGLGFCSLYGTWNSGWHNNQTLSWSNWYNSGWNKRRQINVSSSKITANLTNFPILIDIYDTALHNYSRADGYDILFTSSDGKTKLNHEIEYFDKNYNSTHAHLVTWVKVNLSSVSNNVFYMYYNNSDSQNQQRPSGVWDNNYMMVQHLEETGTGSRFDSTSNGRNMTTAGYEGDEAITGKLDGADNLDGSNDMLNSTSNFMSNLGSFTLEGWIYPRAWGSRTSLYGQNDVTEFFIDGTNTVMIWTSGGGSTSTTYSYGLNSWHHVVAVGTGTNLTLYFDGSSVSSGGSSTANYGSSAYFVKVGEGVVDASGGYFNGTFDEVRVSNIPRSPVWINASFQNQNNPSSFYTIGGETTSPSLSFLVNLSLDGNYLWNVRCNDTLGNSAFAFTNNTFILDNTYPQINFDSSTEANNSNKSQNFIYLNTSITELNPRNITFNLYFSNYTLVNSTTYTDTTRTSINFTYLLDNSYFYNVTVFDMVNLSNTTLTRKITLDTLPPFVDFGIGTAGNNSKFAKTWIYLNTSVVELNEKNITFNLYYSNYTLLNSSTYTDSRRIINWTNIEEGVYFYNVTVFDMVNLSNTTSTRKITLNFTLPSVNYIYPTEENGFSFSRNWIYVNTSVVNSSSEANITFSLYNLSGLVNQSVYTDSRREINWTNLEEGQYYYNVTLFDDFDGEFSTLTRGITLDVTKPNATLIFPENNTYLNNSQQNLTLNATDDFGLSNMTLSVYNETHLVNETTQDVSGTEIITGIVYNFLYDGIFKWFYKIFDLAGNSFQTQNNTITIDTTYPQISYSSNTENDYTNFSRNWIYVNVSVVELNEANVTFRLNYLNGTLVNSSAYTDSRREINWTNLQDAIYSYEVTIVDLAHNVNSTSTRKIGLDTHLPNITLISPGNGSYVNSSLQNLTANLTDNLKLSNLTLFVYNQTNLINQTIQNISGTNLLKGIIYILPYEGFFKWNYQVSDIAVNTFQSENNSFYYDGTYPQISYSFPTENDNTNFSRTWIYINTTVVENNFANITFNLYNSENILVNSTSYNDSRRLINFTSLTDGIYSYNVTVIDLAYNVNSTQTRKIGLDNTGPTITIRSPEAKVYAYNTSLPLNYTIYDNVVGLSMCWWNLDNQANQSINCGTNTTFDTTEGSHTLYFYSNDTFGNLALAKRTFSISIYGPAVSLFYPGNNSYFTNFDDEEIHFNFSDADGIGYCSLYGTWNGGWHKNQTLEINWYGSGWDKRKIINITNPSIYTLEQNYSMLLTLDTTGSEFLENGDDLRIVYWNGTQNIELDRYNSSSFDSANTKIWFRIQSNILAGGFDDNYFIYYSNSDASNPKNNGSNVFDFFEDFNRANSDTVGNGWTETRGTWAIYNNRVRNTNNGDSDLTRDTITANSSFRAIANHEETDADWKLMSRMPSASGNGYVYGYQNNYLQLSSTGHTTSNLGSYGFSPSTGGDYELELNTFDNRIVAYEDGNLIFNLTDSTYASGTSGLHAWATEQFDDIWIRKLIYPEPTYNEGTEELYSAINFSLKLYEDGFYLWNVKCNDSLGYDGWALNNFTFTFDSTYPLISYSSSTENDFSNKSQNWIYINTSVLEENELNITFNLYYSNYTIYNSSTYTDSRRVINWTNLPDGSYYYNVTIFDAVNYSNYTETRKITLDTLSPNVNLLTENNSNFTGYLIPFLNYSVNDSNGVVNCTLYGTWNGGWHANETIDYPEKGVSLNFSNKNVTEDGYYTWNVLCFDNSGNYAFNSTNFTFAAFLPPDSPLVNISQTKNDGTGEVFLSWDNSAHAFKYRIYYTENASIGFTLLNETSNLNYTDSNANQSRRRFYRISSWNPIGENFTNSTFGKTVYYIKSKPSVNTRNWMGIYLETNVSDSKEALGEISNITSFTMWNSTIQKRVTCNDFSCPDYPGCTLNNCNFNIEDGRGYEINLNLSSPIFTNWSIAGIVKSPVDVDLIKNSTSFGKNWISIDYNSSKKNAYNLISSVSYSDAVTNWNEFNQTSYGYISTGSPVPWIPPYIGTNFIIEPEKCYEVSVTQDSLYTQG